MKKLFLIFLFLPVLVLAQPADQKFVYLFHLYYDNGQLFADRDFEFKYDIIPEEFTPETFNTQFLLKGEIINFKNEAAAEFFFDPKHGNSNFIEGKIKVKAPYVADGQKAVFYDSQGLQLLTIFVSESSFCDDDGICSLEKGEDEKTCPNDCAGVTPMPSPERGLFSGTSLLVLLVAVFAVVVGWYFWKRRGNNKAKNISFQ